MKVLEIKNNLVKIAYEAQDNLALSGFVIIEDSNNPYVAQIVNIKGDAESNFAIVKLLFTFDEDGILKNYNGTAPTIKAKVSALPANELLEIIPIENPIFIGNLAQQNVPLNVDKSIFENNLLICSDNLYNTTSLLDNFINQINEKAVIIDTEGQIVSDSKIKLGTDFKLPLNYETIDFIYENDLEDIDAVNKAIIQDIFIEVQNYVKTLPEKFIPFETFISVIDSQYKETQIPELILLKNKLLKYKAMNIFAEELKEIMNLQINIENNNSLIIDISDIPDDTKKEVMRYLYEVLNGINSKIYSFVKVNNSNITKRLLKKFIEKNNVFTTIICPHEFKYIEEVKEISQNIIFFAPLTLTHDFASYNTFLNKLNNSEFIIYGAHTQNIPFIIEITDINDMAAPDNIQSEEDSSSDSVPVDDEGIENEINEEEIASEDITSNQETEEFPEEESFQDIEQDLNEQKNSIDEVEINEDEIINQKEDNQIFEKNIEIVENQTENIIEETEDTEQPQEEIRENNKEESDYIEESEINISENNEQIIEEDLKEENDVSENYVSEEVVEQPAIELSENEIEEEPVVEPLITEESHEQMVEQVSKDVDRMFYEKIDENDDDFADTSEDLTEDDLNLIEDLAKDDIPLAGELEDTVPPAEEKEQPPVVPIYPADDIEETDTPEFQQGEQVTTAKYGRGIVEKMIKYGNKMLCSINFPSIGRRLLDPSITEITKIN